MNDIKPIIAKNIAKLRKANGMTQLELAERLNYSDKAVSKWEHGDSIPDVAILTEIADLFDVSLDYLIRDEHLEDNAELKIKSHKYSRKVITSVSVIFVWFLAVLAFVLTSLIIKKSDFSWLYFIYALPISSIVLLILNSIWFNIKGNYAIISVLMWTFLVSIHLTLIYFGFNVWLIYLVGIPSQVIIILWSYIKKHPKK